MMFHRNCSNLHHRQNLWIAALQFRQFGNQNRPRQCNWKPAQVPLAGSEDRGENPLCMGQFPTSVLGRWGNRRYRYRNCPRRYPPIQSRLP